MLPWLPVIATVIIYWTVIVVVITAGIAGWTFAFSPTTLTALTLTPTCALTLFPEALTFRWSLLGIFTLTFQGPVLSWQHGWPVHSAISAIVSQVVVIVIVVVVVSVVRYTIPFPLVFGFPFPSPFTLPLTIFKTEKIPKNYLLRRKRGGDRGGWRGGRDRKKRGGRRGGSGGWRYRGEDRGSCTPTVGRVKSRRCWCIPAVLL